MIAKTLIDAIFEARPTADQARSNVYSFLMSAGGRKFRAAHEVESFRSRPDVKSMVIKMSFPSA